MLASLDHHTDAVQVDLACGQDRTGGGRRLPRARLGVLNDPGQPFDEGAAQVTGDRPALAEGAFHEAGIPGRASGRSPQAPLSHLAAHVESLRYLFHRMNDCTRAVEEFK